MKKLYLTILILTFGLFANAQTATPPASGNGSEADPYQIANIENLYWLSQNSSFWDANYIQTADIDASETSGWTGAEGDGFPPIGTDSEPFTGVYDGNNYTISNLYINRASDYIGLFGYVGDYTLGGSLVNIILENVDITAPSGGDWWFTGALAGNIYEGEIDNCHTSGTIQAEYIAGGLAGFIDNSVVSNSSSSCNITGLEDIGGFTGDISFSVVSNCKATGDVSGTSWVAGFAGYNDSEIYNCYAAGNVSGENYLGGFVGQLRNASGTPIINNCYAWGNVTRLSGSTGEDIGAFAGNCDDNANSAVEISFSYAIGAVIYEDATNPTDKGFIGTEIGTNTYTANFFDYVTSEQTTGLGATAQLTGAMQTKTTFTDVGWDFMVETTNGTDDYWGINPVDNDGYPFLRWQGYKLHPEISDWPVAENLQCGQTLQDVILNGGSANVSGSFAFVNPDMIPVYGTDNYDLYFAPDDNTNYDTLYSSVALTVIDTYLPTVTCPDNQTINLNEGESFYTVQADEFDPTETSDNCGVADVINDFNASSSLENEELTAGTYTITWTVTDNAGNSAECSFEVVVNDYVGISDIASEISIYPNPTSGKVTIDFPSSEGQGKVKSLEVTDISGRTIFRKDKVSIVSKIDLTNQTAGIYFLKIQTDEGIIFKKIIRK